MKTEDDDFQKHINDFENHAAKNWTDRESFLADGLAHGVDFEALGRMAADPMWNGGGAVCKHTKQSAPVMPETIGAICALCGHPVSWHHD